MIIKLTIKITLILFLLNVIFTYGSYDEALRLYNRGDSKGAAVLFEKEIEEGVMLRIDNYLYLLRSYDKLRDYENILKVSRKALIVNYEIYDFYFYKGYALYKLRKYEKSVKELQKAISLEPSSAYLYNYLGLTYLALNDYNAAEVAFLAAIEYNPKRAIYRYNLARVYEKQQRPREAYKLHLKAVSIYSNFTPSLKAIKNYEAYFGIENTTTTNESISNALLTNANNDGVNIP